jgi:hypothetical protein
MEETTQQQPEATPASLEDVYKEFNVDAVANDFASKVQSQAQETVQPSVQPAAKPVVPDPVIDPEAFKAFVSNQSSDWMALRQTLQNVDSQLKEYKQREIRTKEEADIKQAVELVNKRVQIDPDMVEIALGAEARKDSRFLKLWETRDQNPKAWSKALEAFTNKLEQKTQFRVDPQLVENQRAVKTAQQAMASGAKPPTPEERLGSLNQADLMRELDKIKGSY